MQQCQEELLCNEEDVYQLLSFLDVIKANSTNRIPALTLKHTILTLITKVFISLVHWPPNKWKQGLIVPISKSNNNKGILGDWRPMFLVSELIKLLERHAYKTVSKYVSAHHPLHV